jgi:hypothetical protein
MFFVVTLFVFSKNVNGNDVPEFHDQNTPSVSTLLSALDQPLSVPSFEVYLARTNFNPYNELLSRSHLLFIKHTKDVSKLLIFDITALPVSQVIGKDVNFGDLSKFFVMQMIEKEKKLIISLPFQQIPVYYDVNESISLRQPLNTWIYRFLKSSENTVTSSNIASDSDNVVLKITAIKPVRLHNDKWGGFSALITMNTNDHSKIHCVSLTVSISDGLFGNDNGGVKTILTFQPITHDNDAQKVIIWLEKFEKDNIDTFSNKTLFKVYE